MSDEGIYRPLFVMVEAVEAEIKRKLEPPAQALAPSRYGRTTEDYQRGLRAAFKDETICVHRMPWDTKMKVLFHCKLCGDLHRTLVDEVFHPHESIFVERLINATRALLEAPCNIELRKA